MPNQVVRRLSNLYADGMSVYPAGMRGLARSAPKRGVVIDARPIKPAAAGKFLQWVAATHPKLYAAAERRASSSTLGAVDTKAKPAEGSGALDRILNTITTLAPQYLQARAQKELLDVQLDRARQGLPPLRPTDYAPALQLSVDRTSVAAGAEVLKPYLIWGGVGLAALFIVSQLSRRRR